MKWLKNRARFYLSCNYSCLLNVLVKIKEVKLKNLHTSACLNLNYGTTETKNAIIAKMVGFIKKCDQYSCKFNFGHFLSSIILLPFCWGKIQKALFGGNGKVPGVVMIRTWGKFLLSDISENEQIQLFDLQMHFPVILTPWIWNMVRNTGLRKNSRNILEKI